MKLFKKLFFQKKKETRKEELIIKRIELDVPIRPIKKGVFKMDGKVE